MKLRELIKDIPDDDWLELFEELRGNYKVLLGRCPKRYITGEVLDYTVIHLLKHIPNSRYTLHQIV